MIKAYSLHTAEADIVEDALADIEGQMGEVELLGNTIGIVACHYDFINGGVLEALGKTLPFPLIGFTTFYQATSKTDGLFELTITVLTSDDIRFALAHCHEETTDRDEAVSLIDKAYKEAFADYGERPSLIMSFTSVKSPVTNDEFLRELDKCSGGVPVFGGVTAGDDDSGENMFVISGDRVFNMGFVILLFIGELNCSFYYGNFKDENLMMSSATVTAADGVVVKSLNDLPATRFMGMNGIDLGNLAKEALITVPVLIRQPAENALIARTWYDINEAGEMLFYGEIPEGSILRIGTAVSDDILDVAQQVTREAAQDSADTAAWFLFSCVGRYVALGLEPTLELDAVKAYIPEDTAYLAGYVGGEFCPVEIKSTLANRFHNSSFIICRLG